MSQEYLTAIMTAMADSRPRQTAPESYAYALWATAGRTAGVRSTFQLAKLAGIPEDRFYDAVAVVPGRSLRRHLEQVGRSRLIRHLRRLAASSNATRSRHRVHLCVDDFVRPCRGDLGGLAGLFYCGAVKRTVKGVRVQILAAVIGDSGETIILAERIVPPKHEGPGRPPDTPNQWMLKTLDRLRGHLRRAELSYAGVILSADSAYVSQEVIDAVKDMGLCMVSEVTANRIIHCQCATWLYVELRAGIALELWTALNPRAFKRIVGFDGETGLRGQFFSPTLGQIVVLAVRDEDGDQRFLFSTDVEMKSKTIRRTSLRRWRLERVFWCLRQDLGVGDIHHHIKSRAEVRILLATLMLQVLLDLARQTQQSVGDIVRTIDRSLHVPDTAARFLSAFSAMLPCGAVPDHACAA